MNNSDIAQALQDAYKEGYHNAYKLLSDEYNLNDMCTCADKANEDYMYSDTRTLVNDWIIR